MHAKAHLVTICHRPWEWPFFRVLGGPKTPQRVSVRLESKSPKKGRFGALSVGASNRPVRRTRKGILRVEILVTENILWNILTVCVQKV